MPKNIKRIGGCANIYPDIQSEYKATDLKTL